MYTYIHLQLLTWQDIVILIIVFNSYPYGDKIIASESKIRYIEYV